MPSPSTNLVQLEREVTEYLGEVIPRREAIQSLLTLDFLSPESITFAQELLGRYDGLIGLCRSIGGTIQQLQALVADLTTAGYPVFPKKNIPKRFQQQIQREVDRVAVAATLLEADEEADHATIVPLEDARPKE